MTDDLGWKNYLESKAEELSAGLDQVAQTKAKASSAEVLVAVRQVFTDARGNCHGRGATGLRRRDSERQGTCRETGLVPTPAS